MLGVPRAQRQQVELHYAGGIVRFIQDCVEAVFTQLPLRDNYFWRVYLCGEYSLECCPEYLKRDNFARLQAGLAAHISIHTGSLLDFLTAHDGVLSRFVLLDHMDWLSTMGTPILAQEWNLRVASPPKSDRDFTCASSLLNMMQGYSDVSALTRPQIP
jgi:S-adenosylmethionine-diacylglycerol 3-amino-3-carboxypropyl transferase